MAETAVAKPDPKVTKFFLPDHTRDALTAFYKGQGFGSTLNYSDSQINNIVTKIESTGELPTDLPTNIRSAITEVKPFFDGLTEEIGKYKAIENTLDVPGLERYSQLVNLANKGDPDFSTRQGQSRESFKQEIIKKLSGSIKDPSLVEKLADKAAQRFVVERKTGEQGLTDFIAQEGNLDPGIVGKAIGNFQSNLNEYLTPERAPGGLQNEYKRVNDTLATARTKQAEQERVTAADQLSATQRGQSSDLFNKALAALQQPLPTFSPEFSADMLGNIQNKVFEQGQTALGNVEAAAQRRGITGSSIEAFATSQTEGNIAQTLADATFQFLLTSGQSAQQNRALLVNTLMGQSNALLGAGQQTQGLASQNAASAAGLDLQRQQLQNQIAQFNQTFSESQRQFNDQQAFQQSQVAQNMQLLMQQLSQGKNKNIGGSVVSGLGSGALTGGMVGGPWGAGIGALLGGLSGGLGAAYGG